MCLIGFYLMSLKTGGPMVPVYLKRYCPEYFSVPAGPQTRRTVSQQKEKTSRNEESMELRLEARDIQNEQPTVKTLDI